MIDKFDICCAFNKEGIKQLSGKSGVYFLMDVNDNVLYVGQSKELRIRVRTHLSQCSNIKDQPLFDKIVKVSAMFFDSSCLLENEIKYIEKYDPEFNGVMGGAREGAGRPHVDDPLKNWTIRVHEHEKQPIKELLKNLRIKQIENFVEDDKQ